MFIDGCFWHYCEEHTHLPKANANLWRRKLLANRQRDASNEAILVSESWRVLRIWEHDDPEEAARVVEIELDRCAAIVPATPVGPARDMTLIEGKPDSTR